MGKIGDLFRGEHGSFFKYAVVVTLAFLLLMTFNKDYGFIRWMKAGIELREQRATIRRYQSEIDEMDRQVQLISHDKDSLEGFARERFGFVKPGDDVFLVDEEPSRR